MVSGRLGSPSTLGGLVVVGLLLVTRSGFAQGVTGAVEGAVTAPDGTPLAGAQVTATMPAPLVLRTGVTNRDGVFRLTALPLGEYELTIEHPDHQPALIRQVVVQLGRTTGLGVVRVELLPTFTQEVEVVGARPLIDPTSTSQGGNVLATLFENLPVERGYLSVAALLPNVSVSQLGDGTNFGGATGFENRYFVDGLDMTDPGRGVTGTALPPDFIKEVEVKLGGYDAEYRSTLGGMVNVVTPSGADRLWGRIVGYWTSHLVSGAPKQSTLQLQQRDFASYDVGFSLSGPVVRNRAWFFAAYNPLTQRADVEIPGVGYFPDSSTAHRFAGKVDWRLNEANSLALTVIGDPLVRDGVDDLQFSFGSPVTFLNPDPYLREMRNGGVGTAVRSTHVLSPRALVESSVSYQWRMEQNLPGTERARTEPFFSDLGVWSGGSPTRLDWHDHQWTTAIKATWELGRHLVKGGIEYRNNGERIFATGGDLLTRYADDYFLHWVGDVYGTVGNRIPSAFVQDSWRLGPRLVFNAGLRWARESFVDAAGDVAQAVDHEWQPRVGFVYQPGQVGSQRLYGSFARYYQEVSSSALATYEMGSGYWQTCTYEHDPRSDPSGGECMVVEYVPQPAVKDLDGNRFDEFSLGYQRQFGRRYRGGVRTLYRRLGSALEDGLVTATGEMVWGNPGRGSLAADYPDPTRRYKALEFTFEGQPSARSGLLASYVVSSNRGNYPGLFNTDFGYPWPNANGSFDVPDMLVDADGLLPNDRTHVLKMSAFHRWDGGPGTGGTVLWQGGTPLNEFGGSVYGPVWNVFLTPRGTAGRTPSIFDLSVRLDYTFGQPANTRWRPRVILDVYHLFSARKPVDFDQVHYLTQDPAGNQENPNPTYGMVRRYYPPPTMRLGFELVF